MRLKRLKQTHTHKRKDNRAERTMLANVSALNAHCHTAVVLIFSLSLRTQIGNQNKRGSGTVTPIYSSSSPVVIWVWIRAPRGEARRGEARVARDVRYAQTPADNWTRIKWPTVALLNMATWANTF